MHVAALDASMFDARDSNEEAAEGSVSAGSNLMEAKIQQPWLSMYYNANLGSPQVRRAKSIVSSGLFF